MLVFTTAWRRKFFHVRHVAVQEIRPKYFPQDQVLELLSAEGGTHGRSPGMQPGELLPLGECAAI